MVLEENHSTQSAARRETGLFIHAKRRTRQPKNATDAITQTRSGAGIITESGSAD